MSAENKPGKNCEKINCTISEVLEELREKIKKLSPQGKGSQLIDLNHIKLITSMAPFLNMTRLKTFSRKESRPLFSGNSNRPTPTLILPIYSRQRNIERNKTTIDSTDKIKIILLTDQSQYDVT